MLQNNIINLKRSNFNVQQNRDNFKQHGRRLCLSIDGVTVINKERVDSISNNIKAMFKEFGSDVQMP